MNYAKSCVKAVAMPRDPHATHRRSSPGPLKMGLRWGNPAFTFGMTCPAGYHVQGKQRACGGQFLHRGAAPSANALGDTRSKCRAHRGSTHGTRLLLLDEQPGELMKSGNGFPAMASVTVCRLRRQDGARAGLVASAAARTAGAPPPSDGQWWRNAAETTATVSTRRTARTV